MENNKLKVKDLVNIGIFSALYMAIAIELDLRVRRREAVLPEHRAGGRGVPRYDVDDAGALHLRPEAYV